MSATESSASARHAFDFKARNKCAAFGHKEFKMGKKARVREREEERGAACRDNLPQTSASVREFRYFQMWYFRYDFSYCLQFQFSAKYKTSNPHKNGIVGWVVRTNAY